MLMTSLPYKIVAVAVVVMVVFTSGYFYGRQHGREATLKAAMQAYKTRGAINEQVQNMDGVSLCIALGGVPDECAALMRGLDEAASGE